MILKFFIITFIFSTFLFAQNDISSYNVFSQDLKESNDSSLQDSVDSGTTKLNERKRLWWEAGINVSGFQNINSEERLGYSIGLTIGHKLSNSIDVDISGFVSRQSIILRKRKGTGSDSEFVYRILYDHNISILFIDIPAMINYKIWSNSSISFHAGLGIGYSISTKDYSERTNFVNTGEILDIPIPVDEYYIEDSVFDNSGINVNACIRFNYNNFIIKLLYINKRYDLKRIDKEHTFSLHIGYSLD